MTTKLITKLLTCGETIDANGIPVQITNADLDELANCYDPLVHEAPLVIGHDGDPDLGLPESDSWPSMGWLGKVWVEDDSLYGELEPTPIADEWIKQKYYKHKSIAFYPRDSAINPTPGQLGIRHLALLGAQPPAVKGLGPLVLMKESTMQIATPLAEGDIKLLAEDEKMKPEAIDNAAPDPTAATDSTDASAPETPGPESAAEEPDADEATGGADMIAFLDSNAEDMLRYLLSADDENPDGYSGDISSFTPAPAADNNYLYDAERNQFKGQFTDDTAGQTFDFTLSKSGDSWQLSYQPVASEDSADVPPEDSTVAQSPAEDPTVAKMAEELAQLRNEIRRRDRAEVVQFAETLYADSKLLESVVPQAELIQTLQFVKQNASLVTLAEGETSPYATLTNLLNNLQPIVALGESEVEAQVPFQFSEPPVFAEFSEGSSKEMKQIAKYCEANGMDKNNPKHVAKAQKELADG